jgi:hypothetical protein
MSLFGFQWKSRMAALATVFIFVLISFLGCTSPDSMEGEPEEVVSQYIPTGELTFEQMTALWLTRATLSTGYAKEEAELMYEYGVQMLALVSEINSTCEAEPGYEGACREVVDDIYTGTDYAVNGIWFEKVEKDNETAAITVSYMAFDVLATTTYFLTKEDGGWLIYDMEDENGVYSSAFPIDELERERSAVLGQLQEILNAKKAIEENHTGA